MEYWKWVLRYVKQVTGKHKIELYEYEINEMKKLVRNQRNINRTVAIGFKICKTCNGQK
jgi:hypothetical protein